MVKTTKQTLKMLTTSAIDTMEPEAFDRFAEIVLMALGVQQPDGTLAKDYRESRMWVGGTEDTPLETSMLARVQAHRLLEVANEITQTVNELAKREREGGRHDR